MRLAELAARTGRPLPEGMPDPVIRGLSSDSRSLHAGYLFAALPGGQIDGIEFLEEAVHRGAAAALVPPAAASRAKALGITAVADVVPRRRLARMAAAFYGAQPDMVVAVTGTNGKTSTAHFLAELWRGAGLHAAEIGTLGVSAGPGTDLASAALNLTTPDPVTLHAELASLSEAGLNHAVLEASSHGLDQHRLDGVHIATGILTTVGRDHLDYHGTEHAYRAAKRRLFAELVTPGGTAIFNLASVDQDTLAAAERRDLNVVTYGRGDEADWQLKAVTPDVQGQVLQLLTPRGERIVPFGPLGQFQAENALAALVAAVVSDVPVDDVVNGLSSLTAPAGRLERVGTRGGASVFVDYAHTPDALAAALDALRPHVRGVLHVVFGCGGDRDSGKRLLMGEVAARHADRVTVTDDNPRSEDPATIRAEVLQGAPDAAEVGDRFEAIASALGSLRDDDALLVAGKGHETTQTVRGVATPFDDRAVVRHLLGRGGA